MSGLRKIISVCVILIYPIFAHANIASEQDIKTIAQDLQQKSHGKFDVYSEGRTIVLETYLFDNSFLDEFDKSEVLNKLAAKSMATYATNFINYRYNIYYTDDYGNDCVKHIYLNWSDFLNLTGDLKEVFSTKAHPKACGVNLTMSKPTGWKTYESDRPHIVQRFEVKENSYVSYMITMRALPTFISRHEAREILNGNTEYSINWETYKQEYLTLPFDNTEILYIEDDMVDNYPAKRIEFSGIIAQRGVSMPIYGVVWMVIYEDVSIMLMGATWAEDRSEYSKFNALFNLITNTVHFNDQYTDTDYEK